MKKSITVMFFIFFITTFSAAQDLKVKIYDPPIPYNGNVEWGTDYVVSNSEPFGRPSGVYRNSISTIYVTIPDTNITPGANEAIVILMSSNNGANWLKVSTVSPAAIVSKTKMLIGAPDSVYCFFLIAGTVYSINIINANFRSFFNYTNVGDFDVTISSTGSLYLIIDLYINNEVRIFGSSNGGTEWGGGIFLSATAAHPGITMSATGDTAVINYYGGPFTDTVSSIIRNVRYRESVPGTLVLTGTFTTPIPAGVPKDQFQAVRYGLNAWLFYTSGTAGSIDLNCLFSSDGGTTYGAPFTIGSGPGRDEFWFDAKHYTLGSGGVGLIYYSDSLQSGPPTNNSDYMNYTSAPNSSPSTFITPTRFSEHPPVTSVRKYFPTLIQYYNASGDAGALWVGADGSNARIYFDRLQSLTGVSQHESEIPQSFSLSQNYPNPFNPNTIINYDLRITNYVSLKVYDILGNEVTTIVNEKQNAGSYQIEFDGSNLSSGVYFYELTAGEYSDVKKMTLLK